MDFENEKNQEDLSKEQQNGGREGYQKEFRPVGRSPRPRIHTGQRPETGYERPAYNRHNDDEGGFRPEGFGAGLQSQAPQRTFRPRNNYNNNGGYGQQRQGGYQPRQQGGYRPRYNQEGDDQQGGYQPRGGYGQQRQGGYRQHTSDYDPNAKYSMKKRIEYKEQNFDPNEPVRLNKFLANAGVCSRREADEFIQAGVVTVNGEVKTELGTKVMRTDIGLCSWRRKSTCCSTNPRTTSPPATTHSSVRQ